MSETTRLYGSILITGGDGMLGRALTNCLQSRGLTPISLSRTQLDITDVRAVEAAFATHRPTLVFNCAAFTKVDACETEAEKADRINGSAVAELARNCRSAGACLVHVSTDFVFDGQLNRPYRVDDPVHPMQAYGRSKLLGEVRLAENAPADWLIVRTAWLFGRGGVNFPRTIVQAARAGRPLSVVNDQTGTPTYVPDLAAAIVQMLDARLRGIWHVTNTGPCTWFDFARAVLDEFNIKAEVKPISSADWIKIRPGSAYRPPYTVLDPSPLASAIGGPLRPWRLALADFRRVVEAEGF